MAAPSGLTQAVNLCYSYLPFCGHLPPTSPLAARARLRSRSFSSILTFSEKLSDASRLRISCLLINAFQVFDLDLFPFLCLTHGDRGCFAIGSRPPRPAR